MQQSDSSTQKFLQYIRSLYERYDSDVVRFNYPYVVFYACLNWYWYTDQSAARFGSTVPFFLLFTKDGAGNFELPQYVGPAQATIERIEKEGLSFVAETQKEADQAEKNFQKWISENPPVKEGKLAAHLALLNETLRVFLESHIVFQIFSQLDKPLEEKLRAAFKASNNTLSEKEIFRLSVSSEKADVALHEEKVNTLRAWCENAGLSVRQEYFEKNLLNGEFKSGLQDCYNAGYFLHSGYGGVTLWTMEDEYALLASNATSSEEITTQKEILSLLSPEEEKWVVIARHVSRMRDRRKSLQQKAFYRMAEILEDIAATSGYSRAELECLRIEEMNENFLTNQETKRLISERQHGYLGFWSRDVGTWQWEGAQAESTYGQLAKKYARIKKLQGRSASPGKRRGKVRIVLNPRLQENFNEGDILVTGMTSPDFVPLMKKAGAIITELGGITSHAAIISRELHKPCIIGIEAATKILKDEDMVEVDADNGIVLILD